jgi:ATP synthase protein I
VSTSIRKVILWQLAATVLLAIAAAAIAGAHAALSAALGGLISIVSGLAFSRLTKSRNGLSASGILVVALKAELVRLALMIALVLLVLLVYRDVVVVGLISSFLVTVVIFTMAFFVREN